MRARAAKRDANERAVIDAFEALGCLVQQVSAPGCPDLIVWSPTLARVVLVEVKDGSKVPSARALTALQVAWHVRWKGAPVYVVESIDDVRALIAQDVLKRIAKGES